MLVVQGQVALGRGQESRTRAAGAKGFEFAVVAARGLDQFVEGHPQRQFVRAGTLHVSTHAVQLGARFGAAQVAEPGAALLHDGGHAGDGLHVVNQGRLAPQADLGGEGGLEARHAALAFEGFEQGGFLAADVGAVTGVQVKAQACAVTVALEGGDGAFDGEPRQLEFTAQVEVNVLGSDGLCGDGEAFDDEVWPTQEDFAIFERARFPFVGVQHHVAGGVGFAAYGVPLDVGRKARATPALQTRGLDLRDQGFGP